MSDTVTVNLPERSDFLFFGKWGQNGDLRLTSGAFPVPSGCTSVQFVQSERASWPPVRDSDVQRVPARIPPSDLHIMAERALSKPDDGDAYYLSYNRIDNCAVRVKIAPLRRAVSPDYTKAFAATAPLKQPLSTPPTSPPPNPIWDSVLTGKHPKTVTMSKFSKWRKVDKTKKPLEKPKVQPCIPSVSQEDQCAAPVDSTPADPSKDHDTPSEIQTPGKADLKTNTRSCLKPSKTQTALPTLSSSPSSLSATSKKVQFLDATEECPAPEKKLSSSKKRKHCRKTSEAQKRKKRSRSENSIDTLCDSGGESGSDHDSEQ
ncbi:hypothetical protein MMC13_003370 [Lambiella insularis]|nr:hypothetical protein [Lambiella insularis]